MLRMGAPLPLDWLHFRAGSYPPPSQAACRRYRLELHPPNSQGLRFREFAGALFLRGVPINTGKMSGTQDNFGANLRTVLKVAKKYQDKIERIKAMSREAP